MTLLSPTLLHPLLPNTLHIEYIYSCRAPFRFCLPHRIIFIPFFTRFFLADALKRQSRFSTTFSQRNENVQLLPSYLLPLSPFPSLPFPFSSLLPCCCFGILTPSLFLFLYPSICCEKGCTNLDCIKRQGDLPLNEWRNERIKKLMKEWVNEGMNVWGNEWINEWLNGWMNQLMYE